MALRDGNWRFRLEQDGRVLESSTDDLTLTHMDVVERVSGIPWALWDPRRSTRVAMALFMVLLVQDGTPEDEALQRAQELPGSVMRGAFTWEPPTDPLPATASAGGEAPSPPA